VAGAGADLFVLLSREDLPDVEGFGLVFLEAAACDLPSRGRAERWHPEPVDDEQIRLAGGPGPGRRVGSGPWTASWPNGRAS